MYSLKRTTKEIDEQLNLTWEWEEEGSRFPGMSYEEGVRNAISWLIGDYDDPPMEE